MGLHSLNHINAHTYTDRSVNADRPVHFDDYRSAIAADGKPEVVQVGQIHARSNITPTTKRNIATMRPSSTTALNPGQAAQQR